MHFNLSNLLANFLYYNNKILLENLIFLSLFIYIIFSSISKTQNSHTWYYWINFEKTEKL